MYADESAVRGSPALRKPIHRNTGLRAARWAALPVAAALALGLSACGEDGNGRTPADKAASAASQAATSVRNALDDVGHKFDAIKHGTAVPRDVTVESTSHDADGRATASLSVTNTTDKQADFLIQVDFHNSSGDLVDAVVVTVNDAAPGSKVSATARSHVDIKGDTTAKVPRALRY
ncbi:hypothetical protein [Yinghuangia seranimata]|uniref:hypothetical protein n=1 Tax=Yinghuangia seranimata TaxID=408067 RepID=UPI00248C0F4F|nr:hypothetical protein [Yinghuangia seranimata]MDI2125431.1 hypothetical protein [Yinghuangia seranimata]